MKKTVLLLAVCLMLGLCACGLRGQSVARNTVEPVHFSAPAVRQDAAPAEEPRVTLPQGAWPPPMTGRRIWIWHPCLPPEPEAGSCPTGSCGSWVWTAAPA